MLAKAAHWAGSFRPSANWDMRGTTRSPSQRSMVHRSTWQTRAIVMHACLSSCLGFKGELRISLTSRSARVSSRRRRVSAWSLALRMAAAAWATKLSRRSPSSGPRVKGSRPWSASTPSSTPSCRTGTARKLLSPWACHHSRPMKR